MILRHRPDHVGRQSVLRVPCRDHVVSEAHRIGDRPRACVQNARSDQQQEGQASSGSHRDALTLASVAAIVKPALIYLIQGIAGNSQAGLDEARRYRGIERQRSSVMKFTELAPRAQISRRDALRLSLAAGVGLASAFTGGVRPAHAQQPGPVAYSAPPNPAFPLPPTWDTEMKELAPGVYAYIQAGGPGRNNVSVSDAGVIVGDDGLMVIDSLTAPLHAKAMSLGNPEGHRQAVSAPH